MTGGQILEKLIAVAGLVLMIPLGLGLVAGTLTPVDAAIRAGTLFVSVVVARFFAGLAPTGREVLVGAPETEPVEAE